MLSGTGELLLDDPTDLCRGANVCLGVEWSPFMEGDMVPLLYGPEAKEHTDCGRREDCLLPLHSGGL